MYVWNWDWTWGWLPLAGAVLVLGVFVLPWFFFLLNLHNLLEQVSEENRAMPPAYVWLNFIPLFSLGWFLYTVSRVRDSVKAEYRWRGWDDTGDFAYNTGLAAGILAIVSFFLGWVPLIGWACSIGAFVCWIMYWLKTHELKTSLVRNLGRPVYGGAPKDTVFSPPLYRAEPWRQPGSGYTREPGGPDRIDESDQTGDGGRNAGGFCAACGVAYEPGDRFCRSCGLQLPRLQQ